MPAKSPPGSASRNVALDFLGTLRWRRSGRVDTIATPAGLMSWLETRPERCPVAARLGSLSPPEARILHAEAIGLRSELAALLGAHAAGGPLPVWALQALDRVLATCTWTRRLKDTPSGVVVEERVEPGTSPLSLLGSVALEAAQLLTTVTPSRLRVCASPDCGTWFVDTSKGGRRRWCSMSGCGNRAKAAAHRAKQRDR